MEEELEVLEACILLFQEEIDGINFKILNKIGNSSMLMRRRDVLQKASQLALNQLVFHTIYS